MPRKDVHNEHRCAASGRSFHVFSRVFFFLAFIFLGRSILSDMFCDRISFPTSCPIYCTQADDTPFFPSYPVRHSAYQLCRALCSIGLPSRPRDNTRCGIVLELLRLRIFTTNFFVQHTFIILVDRSVRPQSRHCLSRLSSSRDASSQRTRWNGFGSTKGWWSVCGAYRDLVGTTSLHYSNRESTRY